MPVPSLTRPPGPSADRRRLFVSSASGFVWSMNCDSCELPKNAWMTALTVRALTRSSSEIFSGSELMLIRSLTSRAIRRPSERQASSARLSGAPMAIC